MTDFIYLLTYVSSLYWANINVWGSLDLLLLFLLTIRRILNLLSSFFVTCVGWSEG